MVHLKTFLFCTTVLPMVSFLFLALLFNKGVPHDLPIAVLDQDNTSLSHQATRMVDAGPYVKVAYGVSSIEEGRKLIQEGKANALLVLEDGMERKIMRGESAEAPLFVNDVNLLVGSLVEKDVSTTMQTFSVGIEIQKLTTQGLTSVQAKAASMPINMETHILFNPYTSYAYYLLPGFMAIMLFFFAILSAVFAVGIEFKRGTAQYWMSGASHNIATAVIAKLLPYTIWFCALALLMDAIMYIGMGVPINGSLWVVLLADILLVLAYQWMGVLIFTVLANMRLALSIAAGYSVLAFSFSGLTFPFLGMNPIVAFFGNLFPFTFYTNIFIDQSMRGAPVAHSLPYIAAMCLFVLVGMASLFRLKKISYNSKYWGRD